LENLLKSLASLPNLSSLVIPIYHSLKKDIIYNLIFQLPVLKYCKISYEENIQMGQLPMCTNTLSPIEHLIIDGKCRHIELDPFVKHDLKGVLKYIG
jgi:hypothetical protein